MVLTVSTRAQNLSVMMTVRKLSVLLTPPVVWAKAAESERERERECVWERERVREREKKKKRENMSKHTHRRQRESIHKHAHQRCMIKHAHRRCMIKHAHRRVRDDMTMQDSVRECESLCARGCMSPTLNATGVSTPKLRTKPTNGLGCQDPLILLSTRQKTSRANFANASLHEQAVRGSHHHPTRFQQVR